MTEYNETSPNDSNNFVIYRISLVIIIFFVLIVIFLIVSCCYNLYCTPEPCTRSHRTSWSTVNRNQNRVIRMQKRKPNVEPTDAVDDAR